MKEFIPDYTNILNAARNVKPKRMPFYEHAISDRVMEKVLNRKFAGLLGGSDTDKKEYFKNYCSFFKEMGYDTVTFEQCIGPVMPGSGALGGHKPGAIKTREDFQRYPWKEIPDLFFKKYLSNLEMLEQEMPLGMKAIGGPGNGVFEIVQDIVGYTELCYIYVDDPELYGDLFDAAGEVMHSIWKRFLDRFGILYTVCRFGDDLGFKSSTLIPPEHIRKYIIPQYRKLVNLIHSYNKPFLLHSCGCIFDIMDDLIHIVKIDAKHSNEDQIAPFSVWLDKYGSQIGNFGGIDTDHLCRKSCQEIREIVQAVVRHAKHKGGFALGSGNSIPDYVPVEGYLAMLEAARELRGE